jgi:hypothetical protein
MKYLLLLSLWLVPMACNVASSSQSSTPKLDFLPSYAPETIRAEIKLLQAELQKFHPGLYRYTPKNQLDSSFQATLHQINQPLNSLQLMRLLSPLIAQIKCGHTQIQLADKGQKSLLSQANFFPLKVKIIDNQLVISENPAQFPQLSIGTKILRINGEKVEDLLRRMLPAISAGADGDNQTGKIRYLEQHFAYWYGVLNSFSNNTYIIDYQILGSKVFTLPIAALSWEDYQNQRRIAPEELPLRFDKLPEFDAAILRLKTFDKNALRLAKQDFEFFLRESFAVLRQQKTANLILDLRNNLGGDDDFALHLLTYLLNQPFKMYAYLEVTPHYQGFGKIKVNHSGKFLHTSHNNLQTHLPQKMAFQGKIYCLINGASFSATAEVASVLHQNRRAVLVGEETGGGYTGNTSGITHTHYLKKIGLKVRIPQWAYYLTTHTATKRGVMPDYKVQESIFDLQNRVDKALRQVFELMKK